MAPPDLRKMPPITYRKLGKHGAEGLAHMKVYGCPEDKIEIDSRLKNRMKLETLLHELLHYAEPALPEEIVMKCAKFQAKVIWKLGYREGQ